ncbi:MAG: tetratricopeptide repeat protein [Aureliella sp.]
MKRSASDLSPSGGACSGYAWTFAKSLAHLVCLLATGCSQPSTPRDPFAAGTERTQQTGAANQSYLSTISRRGYVEDSLCRDCHQELYDSYQGVGMAKSFYPATDAAEIEDFKNAHYFHELSNKHFEMERRDGQIFQTRYQLDDSGRRIHELTVKADFILGSGNHIRSYLYRNQAGELFQMPLAWYSQTKEWKLNPGYDRPDHQGFQRRITRECLFCHNAYPTDAQAVDDRHWMPSVFPNALPHGIGCQRCHGPGKSHIDEAESATSTEEDILDSVINPAKLDDERYEDVCNQCHLQPATQVLTQLVRAERAEFDFVPGQSLAQYRALLDYQEPDEEDGRFEINGHAYRFRQSECYLQSAGQMKCTTCHDPHRHVEATEALSHFREACLQCHQVKQCSPAVEIEGAEGDGLNEENWADCQDCHMPKRRTHDAIHAFMTDHKIAIPNPESDWMETRSEPTPPPPNTIVRAYVPSEWESTDGLTEVESNDRNVVPDRVYEWIAQANLGDSASVQKLVEYLRPMAQSNKDIDRALLMPLLELANVLQLQGAYDAELAVLNDVVRLFPAHPRVNLEFAMALSAAGKWNQAEAYYRRSVGLEPNLPEAYMGMGLDALKRGEHKVAESRLKKALELRPLYADAILNLGVVYFAKQDLEAARETMLRALAVDPTLAEAKQYLERLQ